MFFSVEGKQHFRPQSVENVVFFSKYQTELRCKRLLTFKIHLLVEKLSRLYYSVSFGILDTDFFKNI